MEEEEMWLPMPSAPLHYEISSHGRARRSTAGRSTHAGRLLKPVGDPDKGHLHVGLHADGKAKTVTIHRQVARAFHGEPSPGQVARHLNDDRSNNRASNLAWGTQADNAADAKRNGKLSANSHAVPHPLLADLVAAGATDRDIAQHYKVATVTVATWRRSEGLPANRGKRRTAKHGTRSKYVAGCRCEMCTIANRENTRNRRARLATSAT